MTTLDFLILKDLNPKRILFQDLSEYGNEPISPTLHIKFPDFDKIYSTPIEYGTLNILNTKRLGFTDCIVEFSDGVYEITLEVNNKKCELKRKVFIMTQALELLDKKLENVNYTNKETLEKYAKIQLFLHGATSNVCENTTQAEALYKQAFELIKCF